MRIVMIGCVCSYKSSVARKLARMCKMPLFDTDKMIESKLGVHVGDVIDINGIDFFRQQEREIVSILPSDNCIVSCGGGLVLNTDVMQQLCENSHVVWLSTTADTVYSRLRSSINKRPLQDNMTRNELIKHIAERDTYYSKYATLVVKTDNSTSTKLTQIIYNKLSEGK